MQSLLSCCCASCGVLEQHLLAHPYLCLVSCVCVCLLHPCSYDAVSVCVLLAYCLCVCVLHPYLLLRRRVCLCLASLRPCLWCTCERACATIHFSPSQAPEVGYPQRPQLKQKQQAARTSAAQPRSKLNVSAMTWPTAGNVIAPAIRPSTSVMDILPDRPQLT